MAPTSCYTLLPLSAGPRGLPCIFCRSCVLRAPRTSVGFKEPRRREARGIPEPTTPPITGRNTKVSLCIGPVHSQSQVRSVTWVGWGAGPVHPPSGTVPIVGEGTRRREGKGCLDLQPATPDSTVHYAMSSGCLRAQLSGLKFSSSFLKSPSSPQERQLRMQQYLLPHM